MTKILETLNKIWAEVDYPFLIHNVEELSFSRITKQTPTDLSAVRQGDVVALIGDFNPASILTLLRLIDLGAIIVPLTIETITDHEYFFSTASVDVVVSGMSVVRRATGRHHDLVNTLREKHHAGLILFSTGTTGRPKAILHDLTLFLKRFETPRPTLRTINFLLFDHIGGINTLLHTLFNKGVVVAPGARTVDSVLATCIKYRVELLPTTPTFLRLMLMSGAVPYKVSESLKVITYGTERMDQTTLDELCKLLPNVDFRQTFGMSELGIVRVKSEARDSLYMKLGGEGVETRVVGNVLQIRSQFPMLGYLNAPSPFDSDGWYNTKDVVETKNDYYKVVGRVDELINVGGLKCMADRIENVAMKFPGVVFARAFGRENPITGQHVEIDIELDPMLNLQKADLIKHLKNNLPPHMVPKRIRMCEIKINHRYKKTR